MEEAGSEAYPEDVIIVKKAWLTTVAVALTFFIAGAFFGVFVYGRALTDATVRVSAITAGNPATAAQQSSGSAATQAQAPTASPARLDSVSIDDDPSLGSGDAPVVVVEFSDFECPFCARFHSDTLGQILEQYGDDILFVYRDFPISQIHPHAQKAAEAAECADDQGAFWDYHDLLFANQAALDAASLISYAEQLELDVDTFTECVNSGKYADEVLADLKDGRAYGVTGTPTFFINGIRVVGAQPFLNFQQIIEQELGS